MNQNKMSDDEYMVRKFIAYKERIAKFLVDAQTELRTPQFIYLLAVHKEKVALALSKVGEISNIYADMVEIAREFAESWRENGIESLLEDCPKCEKREDCELKNFMIYLRELGNEF